MKDSYFAPSFDGTRLYVRQRRGPTDNLAILCDGIACDGFIWKYLWEDLSEHMSVAHWNYRGHGRSEGPKNEDNIELTDFAKDLDEIRNSLGDRDVILFGHSMGCQVVLEAYRLRPEKIKAIVLICGSYGRITHTFRNSDALAKLLPKMIEYGKRHPHILRALWSRVPPKISVRITLAIGEVDSKEASVDDLVPYLEHVTGIDPIPFLRMLQSAGDHSAEDLLPKIKVPVLIITGEKDLFTPSQYSKVMTEKIPNSELCYVPKATHVVPLERRSLTIHRIKKFLDDHFLLSSL